MDGAEQQPQATLAGGVDIPLLGFGTWKMTGRTAYEGVLAALGTGYRHIDTATMYANEAEVGRAVRDSGLAREQVFVTTKLPPGSEGRERETIENSLGALGIDQVDLWLVHWPPEHGVGLATWEQFLRVRDDGLTRAVGVSNHRTAQVDELTGGSGEAPALNQVKWSPSLYDPVTVAEHAERGVVLEGYSPFRSTDLGHPALTETARELGVTPAQVVVRWHVEHGVVVIPKSATPERIAANFDVFGFHLSPEQVARVDGMSPHV